MVKVSSDIGEIQEEYYGNSPLHHRLVERMIKANVT